MFNRFLLYNEKTTPLLGLVVLTTLLFAKLYSSTFFQFLIEIFPVIVACGAFLIAWNARRIVDNDYFLLLGIGFLFVGATDLLQILSDKTFAILPGYGDNLSVQLRIVARFLHSATFFAAPFFVRRRGYRILIFTTYAAVTFLLLGTIFVWNVFPECHADGSDTLFARSAQMLVSLLFLGGLALLLEQRKAFDHDILRLLTASIIGMILSEFAFASSIGSGGIITAAHLLKLTAFFLVHRAIIVTGLSRPYDLLFRELKQNEERFRTIFSQAGLGLAYLGTQGHWLMVNPKLCTIIGYSQEELMGKTIQGISHPSDLEAEWGKFRQMLDGEIDSFTIESRFIRKDGQPIWTNITVSLQRSPSRSPLHFIAIVEDISDRREATSHIAALNASLTARASELEAANQELEAFSHTVSHDLRAPLTGLMGFSQMMLEQREGLSANCVEFVSNIYQSAKRMDQMIGTMLEFSRLSRAEVKREAVNLSVLAMIQIMELRMNEPGRSVEYDIPEGIQAFGDGRLLRIVLANLLGNAWKYTGKRRTARIEFGQTDIDGKPTYFVRDNGAGFDMSCAADLFTPFKRLHATEDFAGYGIGLATVKRIILRHGGNIWFDAAVDRGAVFYFTIGPHDTITAEAGPALAPLPEKKQEVVTPLPDVRTPQKKRTRFARSSRYTSAESTPSSKQQGEPCHPPEPPSPFPAS